jgi:hypothetical protein
MNILWVQNTALLMLKKVVDGFKGLQLPYDRVKLWQLHNSVLNLQLTKS